MLGKPQVAVWLRCLPCCLACLFQITNQLVTAVDMEDEFGPRGTALRR